jgi:hypothetical protein
LNTRFSRDTSTGEYNNVAISLCKLHGVCRVKVDMR